MSILDIVDTRPPAAQTTAPPRHAPLRIGFDMDGVLADLSTAYHEVEQRLFGPDPDVRQDDTGPRPIAETDGDGAVAESTVAVRPRGRSHAVWKAIQSTPDFWMSLQPLEEGGVRRVHEMMLRHRWEVFFITQRPRTAGDTVQRQSQRWLVEQGFDLPSVLVLGGSRGAAAGVLRLNYHLDDSPQNCLDVLGESNARPILVVPDEGESTVLSARKLGIGTAPSLTACLDILERATLARAQPEIFAGIASQVGWR